MSSDTTMLIIGAGQAGATAAAALRSFGHAGRIVVVGSEHALPYERPPLSKAVLADAAMDDQIGIHPAGFHAEQSIELRLGVSVTRIDTSSSLAHCGDGAAIAFDRCLLATGGWPRTLPALPEGTPGVHYVRTLDDVRALRAAMERHRAVLVLGAGFLGLEIASTARSLGLDVTVVETASRVLARAVPPDLSAWLQQRVRAAGVDLRLDSRIARVRPEGGGVRVEMEDGAVLDAPLVVVAVGLVPEVALARASGLELSAANGGIRVDAQCRTSAPNVYAAGDCASQFQSLADAELRLESWQGANEQARVAAAAMLGVATGPVATPWFWTDQFDCNVQMLGTPVAGLEYLRRGAVDAVPPKFMLLGLDAGQRLRHAIAINAGGDLRQLRPLLELGAPCDAVRLQDTAIALRQIVRDATPPRSTV